MPERDKEGRREAIERWVEYIEANPPEVWGPQQNAVVDGQLEAADAADLPVEHSQYVRELAADLAERDGEPSEK